MPEYEKAFSDFQDSEESEQTHNAIFILVRIEDEYIPFENLAFAM